MAGYDEMVTDARIIFWQGQVAGDSLAIDQVRGDPEMIQMLFGQDALAGELHDRKLKHPALDEHRVDETMTRQLRRWIESFATGSEWRSIRFQYDCVSVSVGSSEAGHSESAQYENACLVRESITAISSSPPNGLTILGHMELARQGDLDVALVLKALHKINNNLSVASLALDMISIKASGDVGCPSTEAVLASCQSARDAIQRAGEISSQTAHKIHR